VFNVTLSGKEKTLYEFKGSAYNDGAFPSGPLVASGDTLYGTTIGGGVSKCGSIGCGTIFSVTMNGKENCCIAKHYDVPRN